MTLKPKVTASLRSGWRATGSELAVRRMTNSIRRDVTTSLLIRGEVWKLPSTLEMAWKAMLGRITWLEAECWEVCARQAGRPVTEVTVAGVRVCVVPQSRLEGQGKAEGNRSPRAGEQTPPNARTNRWKSAESKAAPRKETGRWKRERQNERQRKPSDGSAGSG